MSEVSVASMRDPVMNVVCRVAYSAVEGALFFRFDDGPVRIVPNEWQNLSFPAAAARCLSVYADFEPYQASRSILL